MPKWIVWFLCYFLLFFFLSLMKLVLLHHLHLVVWALLASLQVSWHTSSLIVVYLLWHFGCGLTFHCAGYCTNAPCSLPGQNMRQESGCKEGERGAAVSDADSLTGEFHVGAIKPRKIPTEHLIGIGICFAVLTEYLQSVTWCVKGTRVAGLCV